MIAHRNTFARANLVLPLTRHHLGVTSSDLHASVQTAPVMLFYNRPTIHVLRTIPAVIWSLAGWEPTDRPTVRVFRGSVQQSLHGGFTKMSRKQPKRK